MERTCCIFGAGDYGAMPRPELDGRCFLIAADGGYGQLKQWGMSPHLAVGDFDSLGRVPEDVEVVRHPVRKDDTDMMLAVQEGLARGCGRFLIYGGLGGRLDHTLANLHSLAFLARKHIPAFLLGPDAAITAVCNGTLSFPAGYRGTLSLFAWGGAAEDVTLSGLRYPLDRGVLVPDRPLGVSNEFLDGQAALVTAGRGTVLALWTPQPGLPLPDHTT